MANILRQIQEDFENDDYRYTEHGRIQSLRRRIADWEIQQAVKNGEVIEDYPHDKYGASCLIYGETVQERPLHILCSYPPNVRVITVYEPSSDEWIDYRIRK